MQVLYCLFQHHTLQCIHFSMKSKSSSSLKLQNFLHKMWLHIFYQLNNYHKNWKVSLRISQTLSPLLSLSSILKWARKYETKIGSPKLVYSYFWLWSYSSNPYFKGITQLIHARRDHIKLFDIHYEGTHKKSVKLRDRR